MYRIIFYIAVLMIATSGQASAQSEFSQDNPAFQLQEGERARSHDMAYFYNPRFDQMARMAFVTWPNKHYSFYHLRSYYPHTRQYDPIGTDVINALSMLTLKAEKALTLEEKTRIGGRFQDLVFTHLANLDIVLFALSYARDDTDYGDPKFYEWVRDGILYDIMSKSDGKTMDDPFELITLGEETAIFSALKVKPVHTELIAARNSFFHIHLVEDFASGVQSEIFTNVSIPMRFMRTDYHLKKRDTPKPLNLRRQ